MEKTSREIPEEHQGTDTEPPENRYHWKSFLEAAIALQYHLPLENSLPNMSHEEQSLRNTIKETQWIKETVERDDVGANRKLSYIMKEIVDTMAYVDFEHSPERQAYHEVLLCHAFHKLLEDGAHINLMLSNGTTTSMTPLIFACRYNFTDLIHLLLSLGANPNQANDQKATPLSVNSHRQNPEKGKALLKKFGAECDGSTCDVLAATKPTQQASSKSSDTRHSSNTSSTGASQLGAITSLNDELIQACRCSQLEKVKTLVSEQTVDINYSNSDGITPILAACAYQQRDIAHWLLAQPAIIPFRGKLKKSNHPLWACITKATDDTMSSVCIKLFSILKGKQSHCATVGHKLLKQLKRTYSQGCLTQFTDFLLYENALSHSKTIMSLINQNTQVCTIKLLPTESTLNIHFPDGLFENDEATLCLVDKTIVVSQKKLVEFISKKCLLTLKDCSKRFRLAETLSTVTKYDLIQAISNPPCHGSATGCEQKQEQHSSSVVQDRDPLPLMMTQLMRTNKISIAALGALYRIYSSSRKKRFDKITELKSLQTKLYQTGIVKKTVFLLTQASRKNSTHPDMAVRLCLFKQNIITGVSQPTPQIPASPNYPIFLETLMTKCNDFKSNCNALLSPTATSSN